MHRWKRNCTVLSRVKRKEKVLPTDPSESARIAGLHYVSLDTPGFQRRRAGKGWIFLFPDGRRLTDKQQLARIRSLVIPPAWTDVWICTDAGGHLQAVGVDARGRKQYRYHPEYRAVRDATKFARMIAFGKALPAIRKHVRRDLRRPGLPREKVLAALVRLLEETSIRVGNEEYVRSNRSYGLTTLRDRHATIRGGTLALQFKGKSGVGHETTLSDRSLARIVRQCQEIPGQVLFQYIAEDGTAVKVSSEDLNAYIREISGADFTAKDFRTWNGTRHALRAFRIAGPPASKQEAKKTVVEVVKQVAEVLGNRPATCKKYYIHPYLAETYLEAGEVICAQIVKPGRRVLAEDESMILRLLSDAAK